MPELTIEVTDEEAWAYRHSGGIRASTIDAIRVAARDWCASQPVKVEVELTLSQARVLNRQYPEDGGGFGRNGIVNGVLYQIADKLREGGYA